LKCDTSTEFELSYHISSPGVSDIWTFQSDVATYSTVISMHPIFMIACEVSIRQISVTSHIRVRRCSTHSL